MHAGIEAFYSKETEENPVDVVKRYCRQVEERAEELGVPLDEEYELQLRKAEIIMAGYMERYEGDFEKWNVTEVERKFELPTSLEDVCIAGKIDGIATKLKDGIRYGVERKTASSWDPDLNRLMLDFQVSVYAWAISKIYGWKDVPFLYDVIRKPSIRPKKKESEEQYLERLEEDLRDRPDFYFIRNEVVRSRREIARTEMELIAKSKRLLDLSKTGEVYRNSGEHCFYRCDYRSLCLDDTPELREELYIVSDARHEELKTDVTH